MRILRSFSRPDLLCAAALTTAVYWFSTDQATVAPPRHDLRAEFVAAQRRVDQLYGRQAFERAKLLADGATEQELRAFDQQANDRLWELWQQRERARERHEAQKE